ncbi:MAG TPA: hypothetical protein VGS96_11905 [Thermoanaerobaculia bacterium]|nr:hypothetical protein [Thermoanaerobaculia bacterium]
MATFRKIRVETKNPLDAAVTLTRCFALVLGYFNHSYEVFLRDVITQRRCVAPISEAVLTNDALIARVQRNGASRPFDLEDSQVKRGMPKVHFSARKVWPVLHQDEVTANTARVAIFHDMFRGYEEFGLKKVEACPERLVSIFVDHDRNGCLVDVFRQE